ncbi:MAG: hypothetical protein M1828_003111 [Chrysothrix sp. TS-e1954]|nr:MAG: hypothetical protein M1828_003111 [Chrysothrix sp. TS-e1954]
MGDRWHASRSTCLALASPSDSPEPVPNNSENEPRSFGKSFGLLTPPESPAASESVLKSCTNHGSKTKEPSSSPGPIVARFKDLRLDLGEAHIPLGLPLPAVLESPATDQHLRGNLDGEAAEKSEDEQVEEPHASTTSTSNLRLKNAYLNRRLRPSQRPKVNHKACHTSTQTPDRFTIPRRAPHVSREALMVGKPTSALKYREKVRRRRSSHSDPFGYPERENESLEPPRLLRPQRVLQPSHLRPRILGQRVEHALNTTRQISTGAVWNVGGRAATTNPMQSSQSSRTILNVPSNRTPLYTSRFLQGATSTTDIEMHERRLALALGIDRTKRVLASLPSRCDDPKESVVTVGITENRAKKTSTYHSLSILLEAPGLRDDFYCSVLAFSKTANLLAVGLADKIYMWNELERPWSAPQELGGSSARAGYITSLAFSSDRGERAILAISHGDGQVVLWSPKDADQRVLRLRLAAAAVHVSFRPLPLRRPSQRILSIMTDQEMLLVGEDSGAISVYFVEWPRDAERDLFGWHGGIVLHCRLAMHRQQICGIAWSTDGELLATGGNDNRCYLIETNKILASRAQRSADLLENLSVLILKEDVAKHQWRISAAVKAIAFCPWQRGLIAVGGGSNDRCIHFYHTISGACLATIDCAAQVTSLIWSPTRCEIAATFGFAQPDHPFRVAVYSWPSCNQIIAIPWHDEMRALYAIPYPGGPDVGVGRRNRGAWWRRANQDGCIVVAGSDGSVKFHEVWCESRRAAGGRQGLLGGSDILESLHGIDKDDAETIR